MEIANLIAALRAPDCDNCPCTECKPDRNLTRCMLFDKAADAVPAGITIRTYNNGVLVEEYAVESEFEITRELAVIHNFDDFDTMEVEFTKTAQPYNRIVLNYFSFGDITNFTMERMDMTSSPKAINSQHMRKIKEFGQSIISKGKEGTEEHSPSKAFRKIGAFVIEGFNIGIEDMIPQSFKVMDSWLNGINGYQPTMSFAVDTSALKYYNGSSFAKTVSANVTSKSNFEVDGTHIREEFRQAVLEALNESRLAEDMRRQADKPEQTVVQIGNRTVTDAVTTQQRANGYAFAK